MTDKKKKTPVTIYFCDEDISVLFCALLAARGVPTKTTVDRAALNSAQALVTEARFFELLNPNQKERALIVGNKLSLEAAQQTKHTVLLSQPLTESKVERAIDDFVARWESVAE